MRYFIHVYSVIYAFRIEEGNFLFFFEIRRDNWIKSKSSDKSYRIVFICLDLFKKNSGVLLKYTNNSPIKTTIVLFVCFFRGEL